MNKQDFTPGGVKIEGVWENDRNAISRQLFKDIIREVCGVQDVLIGHHICYEYQENQGGFNVTVMEEVPSADTLIFDHLVAQKIWGKDWGTVLTRLVLIPAEERDAELAKLYYGRGK